MARCALRPVISSRRNQVDAGGTARAAEICCALHETGHRNASEADGRCTSVTCHSRSPGSVVASECLLLPGASGTTRAETTSSPSMVTAAIGYAEG